MHGVGLLEGQLPSTSEADLVKALGEDALPEIERLACELAQIRADNSDGEESFIFLSNDPSGSYIQMLRMYSPPPDYSSLLPPEGAEIWDETSVVLQASNPASAEDSHQRILHVFTSAGLESELEDDFDVVSVLLRDQLASPTSVTLLGMLLLRDVYAASSFESFRWQLPGEPSGEAKAALRKLLDDQA